MPKQISKEIRKRIKKYSKILGRKNPDIRFDCLIEAYQEANSRMRKLYDKEMENLLGPNSVDNQ